MPSSAAPTRRSMALGAAWAVPAVAAAASAPALASSVCACNIASYTDSMSAWTYRENSGFGGGPNWSVSNVGGNSVGTTYRDRLSANPGFAGYYWITRPVTVCVGKTYCYSFRVQATPGLGGAGVNNVWLDVGWSSIATTSALDYAWNRSFYTQGVGTYYTSPNPGAAFTGTRQLIGVGGVWTASQSACWTATTSGTAYLKYRWTMQACTTGGGCNDDTSLDSLGLTCA